MCDAAACTYEYIMNLRHNWSVHPDTWRFTVIAALVLEVGKPIFGLVFFASFALHPRAAVALFKRGAPPALEEIDRNGKCMSARIRYSNII